MPTIERPDKKKPKKESPSEDAMVALWRPRLQRAEKKLKKRGGNLKERGSWKVLIDYYEGKQWPFAQARGRYHRITANQIKNNVDSIRPQLYFNNPRVRISIKNPDLARQDIPEMEPGPMGRTTPAVDPQTGAPAIRIPAGTPVATIGGQLVDAKEQVDLLEAIDNYYLEEMGAKLTIRRVINDALIVPYGVAKLEWVVEISREETADPETGEISSVENFGRQYPRLTRIKPWCFLWDPDLDEFNIESSDWVAEIKMLSKEDIEADDMLSVDFRGDSPTPYHVEEEYEDKRGGDDDEDRKRYKLYEIHDLKNGRMIVLLDGASKPARVEDPSGYADVEGSIYAVLGFHETPDDSFPLAIPDQIKSLVEGYNYMLSFAVNHAERGNRKYKYLSGTMSAAEKEKWEQGADLTTVEVKNMEGGPEPIQDAPVPSDVYSVQNILKREITEAIGTTAYSRGTREPGIDTAYEASLIQGGSDAKVEEKRDIVKEFVKRLVRKLNQILKLYADKRTAVRIAGAKGERWISWTAEDIKGEFLEDVDIYSSMPYSELEEKKQAMEMFSLAQNDIYFDPMKIRQKVVRIMKWDEDILLSPERLQEVVEQQRMQAEQEAGQAQQIRPTEGEVRRRPDVVAGIRGPVRRPT